jgi:hypothetical protein
MMFFEKHCPLLVFTFPPSQLPSNTRPQPCPGVGPYSRADKECMQKHPTSDPFYVKVSKD